MNEIAAERTAVELGGAIGDHFVDVHVEADASTSLEHIDDNLIVPTALLHFLCCDDDRVSALAVHQSQLSVRLGGSLFHHGRCFDQCVLSAHSTGREIFCRTCRLYSVENVGWNFSRP